tara:strand:- start:384 stop:614 length:231 start_codon:yes stop_codon:yes gene_type:complete
LLKPCKVRLISNLIPNKPTTKPMQDLLIKNALNAIAKSRRELTEYLLVESNKKAYIDAALYYGYRLEEVNYPIDRV